MKQNLSRWQWLAGVGSLMMALFLAWPAGANNIEVANVSWSEACWGQTICFDIQWENSWRSDLDGDGKAEPYNYDAAWVFAKWRTNDPASGVIGEWQHLLLSTNESDHHLPAGCALEAGLDGRRGAWGENAVGVFLFRAANGSGPFSAKKVRLRWQNLDDSVPLEVQVFAIEMVYCSSGQFYVGAAGVNDQNHFHDSTSATAPFLVTDEDVAIIVASNTPPVEGELWYLSDTLVGGASQAGDLQGPIPAEFPKGVAAFYCMKYEMTQKQYADFLNTLTRDQQTARCFAENLGDFMFQSKNRKEPVHLVGEYPIRCGVQVVEDDDAGPRVYACNLNTDNPPNSADDGQWIVCPYVSWPDGIAYFDWAGLRPMTELEFEKACRGPKNVVNNERAWGSASATLGTVDLIDEGTAAEVESKETANIARIPMRVGSFGIGTGDRVRTGAGYYGMMEMSGNLGERAVSVGRPDARAFTGEHGDGSLTEDGDSDVADWPEIGSFRGHCYGNSYVSTSCRRYGAGGSVSRTTDSTIRGVRTAR